eukprot:2131278-Rhodomonas_salina.1
MLCTVESCCSCSMYSSSSDLQSESESELFNYGGKSDSSSISTPAAVFAIQMPAGFLLKDSNSSFPSC